MKIFTLVALMQSMTLSANADNLESKIPRLGCYNITTQSVYLTKFYYERQDENTYRIVPASTSDLCAPNQFASPNVVSESEMFSILVRSGVIRPNTIRSY